MKKYILFLFILATAAFPQTQMPFSNAIIPSGSQIDVRVNDNLRSDTAQSGDRFTATLMNSIDDDNGDVIFPKGSTVTGHVVSARPSGRLSDSGELVLSINNIRSTTLTANLTVNPHQVNGASHNGSNTAKIGGGAILGAIIGGLAGGGKGAAIGAGAGSAAGAGAAAATGKKEASVDSETILHFVTSSDTPVAANGSPEAQQIERDSQRDAQIYSPQPPYQDTGSDNDPDRPVLKHRDGSAVPVPQGGSSVSASGSSRQASVNTPSSGSENQYPPATSGPYPPVVGGTNPSYPNSAADQTVPNRFAFTARDRRVINNCLANNPHITSRANALTLQRNDVLTPNIQQQAMSLPLSCENQLAPVANNLERVIYSRQVMLIDSAGRVLDVFTLGSN